MSRPRRTASQAISDNEQVENLCRMFAQSNVTLILNQLECQRKTLNEEDFKTLLSSFVSTFSSANWSNYITEQRLQIIKKQSTLASRNRSMHTNLARTETHCYRIIFYYIVSVIEKYGFSNTEEIWKNILQHSSADDSQFFEYLFENKITIPTNIRDLFLRQLKLTCVSMDEIAQTQFFQYGIIFPEYVKSGSSVRFLEKFFSRLKLQDKSDANDFAPEDFICHMNTPEKLSLFLSVFPDYDINQSDPKTNRNVLEKLLAMDSYFSRQDSHYIPFIRRGFRRRPVSNLWATVARRRTQFNRQPTNLGKYRTARIISLLQQLINRGAQLSRPIFSHIHTRNAADRRFSLTSIGLYVLLSLNPSALYPEQSSFQRDTDFILLILEYIKRFSEEYQNLIVGYLPLTYSVIHQERFMLQRRRDEQSEDQQINDRFFQRPLSLKECCRLKIRDHCAQRNMTKLGLTSKLTSYCSYGFSESNFGLQCINRVTQHKGKDLPGDITHEFYEMLNSRANDDRHSNSEGYVDSGDEHHINEQSEDEDSDESDHSSVIDYADFPIGLDGW